MPPQLGLRSFEIALGLNDAWDAWGSTLRAAYNTTKAADEDIFTTTLTLWTDNGAATLGAAWAAAPGTECVASTLGGSVLPQLCCLGPDIY